MIDIQNLSLDFGDKILFENVNVRINQTDKIALVGLNGTGKSTFLKIIKGEEKPASGKVLLPKNFTYGYLPQEFVKLNGLSLIEEVKSSFKEYILLEKQEYEINLQLENENIDESEKAKLLEQLGKIIHRKEETDFYELESRIEKVLMGLGFTKDDFNKNVKEFSGGWQMRIELAKILLNDNDILLLDEPTNHLDIDSLWWLTNFLQNYKGAILLISHDKFFINKVTDKTLEIANKKITFFNGSYDKYIKAKKIAEEQAVAAYKNQQKKIKETERFIERFRYKASKASQVQSRIKQLEKLQKIEIPEHEKNITIKFPEPPRSSVIPVKLDNVTAGYGEKTVFRNLDLQIERGEKIALVGKNGTGKSTLLKIVSGQLQPLAGKVIYGQNTKISYYAQEVAETFNLEDDILSTLSNIPSDLTEGQLRTVLGAFLFHGDDVKKKIKILSGGEKSRVALASILLQKANVVVLDEPTNHLDYQSKEILQEALKNYKGALLIASHDIDFLKNIVDKVIEFQNGEVKYYYGDIEYYLAKKHAGETEFTQEKEIVKPKINNRKEQKRIEAELRQKKFRATKDLIKNIEKCESEISRLEEKIKILETELADEKIYSNPLLSKEKTLEYKTAKQNLDEILEEWTQLSEKLEEIEKQYS